MWINGNRCTDYLAEQKKRFLFFIFYCKKLLFVHTEVEVVNFLKIKSGAQSYCVLYTVLLRSFIRFKVRRRVQIVYKIDPWSIFHRVWFHFLRKENWTSFVTGPHRVVVHNHYSRDHWQFQHFRIKNFVSISQPNWNISLETQWLETLFII